MFSPVPKLSSVPHNTLLVGRNDSSCNNCGKGANPLDKTHDFQYFYGPESGELPACGIEWKFIMPMYIGTEKETAALRPDLELLVLLPDIKKESDATD